MYCATNLRSRLVRPTFFQEFVLDMKAFSRTLRRRHPMPDRVARMYHEGEDFFPDFYYNLRKSRKEFNEIKVC